MNLEKYPNYFLGVCVLYAFAFLVAFSRFVVPTFGILSADYFLIIVLLILPLILIAVYSNSARFHFLWGKENILRIVISALTLIDFLLTLYFMILLI